MRFPVCSQPQPLQLYKIITMPDPTPNANTTMHATQLLDLPDFFAVTYQHDYYIPLTSTDLANCMHGSTIVCNFNLELIPKSVPQCSLALFQNNVNRVSKLCKFRFLENSVFPLLWS